MTTSARDDAPAHLAVGAELDNISTLGIVDSVDQPPIDGDVHRLEASSQTSQAYARHTRQVIQTSLPLYLGDVSAAVIALAVSALVTHLSLQAWNYAAVPTHMIAMVALVSVVFPFLGLYPGYGMNPALELRQLVLGTSITFATLWIANICFGQLIQFEMLMLPLGWSIAVVLVPATRWMARSIASRFEWWGQVAAIIGDGHQARQIFDSLDRSPSLGIRVAGFIHEYNAQWQDDYPASCKYLGTIEELPSLVRKHRIGLTILTLPERPTKANWEQIERVTNTVPNLVVLPGQDGLPSLWNHACECAGQPAIHLREGLLLPLPQVAKRVLDLVIIFTCSVPILALTGLIAFLIRVTSKGPALYRQTRVGRNGKCFGMYKFRTMVVNADKMLEDYFGQHPELRDEWERDRKLRDDPRVTRIGRILRKTSLDELPQLINVVRGEMSLVGPRPLPQYHLDDHSDVFQELRTRVLPGMTGMWQISGRTEGIDQIEELDKYYIRNWSPWLDTYILSKTAAVVLLQKGAY